MPTPYDHERRLQTGAALLLGAVALVVILWRGRGMLPPHWWRPW